MTRERWDQVSDVYYTLVALTAEERCTIIEELCGGDEKLRAEVDSLLSADQSAGTFLFRGAIEDAAGELTETALVKADDRIGSCRILGLIGTGGSGEVYRAWDETLDRDVAIKLLNPEFASAEDVTLGREARVLASLNHSGIAAVYSLLEVNSTPAIVMEYVEGPTLGDRLSRGPIPLNQALPFALQLAGALEYAHERGIVHRDLKPANLKIAADGNLKILDFGLAEFFPRTGDIGALEIHSAENIPGQLPLAGTPPYMAPEQLEGKACDRRVDIWAFGVVLFELLAAERPWPGRTIAELLDGVSRSEPDWNALPKRLPQRLRELLERCLRKDPRSRLRDIGDARLAIEEYLANPTAVPLLAPQKPSLPRRSVLAAAAVLTLLSILAGLAYRNVRVAAVRPLMRVSLGLGPEAALSPLWPNLAISRDGTKIVYGSKAPDGGVQLSIRRLDQQTSVSLPGAEGIFPFFSPDGRWIAFFSNGLLKKVPVEGGPSVVLCDAPDPRGGAWGDDDEIVFAGHSQGGLSGISASGGEISAVTELDTSAGEMTHRWPQMLPGSNVVLFTAHNTLIDYDFATIQVQDLKTGRRRVLVRGGYFGRYFAPGYLLYVRSGTLFGAAMRLPPKIISSALPVIGPVDNSAISGLANITASEAGSLIYTSTSNGSLRRKIAWLDEAGRREAIRAAPGLYRSLRISPDGKFLAFSVGRELGSDLWILDLARSAMLRLTFAQGASECPVWTPDGKHIAFVSNRDGRWRMYWARVDGAGNAQPITDGGAPIYPASFAPDGKQLCAIELNRKTSADVVILAIGNAESDHPQVGAAQPFVSSPAVENHPSFSPDGHFIAYTSAESGTTEVYVKPYPDDGVKKQISNEGGIKPLWSRKGNRLFYVESSGGQAKMMMVDYRINQAKFIVSKPRCWSQQRLSLSDVYRDFDIAPDGRMAVYTEAEPASNNTPGRLELLLNLSDELERRLRGDDEP